MAKIEIEVTDQEKEWITGYAELQGLNISEAVVRVIMDKLREGGFMSEENESEVRGRREQELKGVYEGLSLDDLFAGCGDGIVYRSEEIDWGEPVGEEVW